MENYNNSNYIIEKLTRQGRPTKGSKKEFLNPEEIKFLHSISINTIIKSDRRIQDIAEKWAQKRLKSKIDSININKSLSFGLLVSLIHPIVLQNLNRQSSSIFKILTPIQIHIILSAWVVCQLTNKVFQSKQLLDYCSNHNKISNKKNIQNELCSLEDMGIIEIPDNCLIYQYTNKIPMTTGQRGRPSNFYIFTRKGNLAIKEYLNNYKEIHLNITGNLWISDLQRL